jgi:hypothetical protein
MMTMTMTSQLMVVFRPFTPMLCGFTLMSRDPKMRHYTF